MDVEITEAMLEVGRVEIALGSGPRRVFEAMMAEARLTLPREQPDDRREPRSPALKETA